jgi:hypothetical protein
MKIVFGHGMKHRLWMAAVAGAMLTMAHAQEPMLADPTRPSAAGEAYEPAAFAGPTLQSTVIANGERRAVISGRRYRVGDRLGVSVVAEILPYEVILRPAGGGAGETRLRMLPRLAKEPVPGKGSAP